MSMTRPALAMASLLALAAAPALAQPAPGFRGAPMAPGGITHMVPPDATRLSLSETGEVRRPPDELQVILRAEARGAGAAAVQAAVNARMEKALAAARQVDGLHVSTGGYYTQRNDETQQWTASQTLELRGQQASALLELAGRLQQDGMAMAGMNWSLSRPEMLKAREEAASQAIDALRQRAEAVARQLSLRVDHMRELRLDTPEAPMFRMMAAPAARGREAASAPPPVSAPDDVTVSATAGAEFLLRP